MEPEIKSLNFIFPTKYVVPKSLRFSDWLSKEVKIQTKTWNHHLSWCLKGFRQRLFHVPYVPVMPKMFFFATLGPLRLCSLSGFGPQRISIYIICIKQERCRFRNDNFGCPECFKLFFFGGGVIIIVSILFDILLSMLHVSGPRIALEDMYLQHENTWSMVVSCPPILPSQNLLFDRQRLPSQLPVTTAVGLCLTFCQFSRT